MPPGERGSGQMLTALLGLCLAIKASEQPGLPRGFPEPLPPAQALQSLRVVAGFVVEQVAAEPLVQDPVALTWDEQGRLFVVEMGDYPNGPPGGRIKLLWDNDGDGVMDRAVVFAEDLPFPTGAFPWRGGLLVTAAPHIWYLRDTDGDGRADERRILYSGFHEGNQQHRVNGLCWGMDNWIYGANGDSGGQVSSAVAPQHPAVRINGRDFRIRPDRGLIEPVSGMSQFGHTFDRWGRRFLCNNRQHIYMPVLPEVYLSRSPDYAPRQVVTPIADYGHTGARVYPISPVQERFNDYDHVGSFTSACGLHIYRGGLFPAPFAEAAFVCEPVHNLVHACRLRDEGVVVRATRLLDNQEFLAATDPWFRPVFLATGSDGALYVADFYRAVIEHPQWIPPEVQKRLNLKAGADRGRIYRIYPRTHTPERVRSLADMSAAQLVQELRSTNGWRVETAARLLFERQDKSAVPALIEALRDDQPQVRLRALWALDGLGALERHHVLQALRDPMPRIREHALVLAETWLPEGGQILERVQALADDPDARVRFQLALSLWPCDAERVAPILARIAWRSGDDPWIRTALLVTGSRAPVPFLRHVLENTGQRSDSDSVRQVREALVEEIGAVLATRYRADELRAAAQRMVSASPPEELHLAFFKGLARGMLVRGKRLEEWLGTDPAAAAARDTITRTAERASGAALDARVPLDRRVAALRLLLFVPSERATELVQKVLQPEQPLELQLEALRLVGARDELLMLRLPLQVWPELAPAVQREALEMLFRRADRLPLVVEALKTGQIKGSDLDASRRQRLLESVSDTDRAALEKLLGSSSVERRAVLASYRQALHRPPDLVRGHRLFTQHCATCHQLHGEGKQVGPSLHDVAQRTPEALLEDILDPNAVVAPGYANYLVETRDGRIVTGIVAQESSSHLVLRRAEGVEDVVLRKDIAQLRSTGTSLMPEGLEKTLSPQDVADIIEYLRNSRPGQ
ncbi:MAG: hypothetical protein C4297_10560 [Gemmataceae bacterium]